MDWDLALLSVGSGGCFGDGGGEEVGDGLTDGDMVNGDGDAWLDENLRGRFPVVVQIGSGVVVRLEELMHETVR